MSRKINLKKILKNNPHISKKDLDENRSLFEELRKAGVQPRGYQLAPPFTRRYAAGEEEKPDPRAIKLNISRI